MLALHVTTVLLLDLTANAINIDGGIFNRRSVLIRGAPKGRGAAGVQLSPHIKILKNTGFVDPIILNVPRDLPSS